jgi:hypothetical protein
VTKFIGRRAAAERDGLQSASTRLDSLIGIRQGNPKACRARCLSRIQPKTIPIGAAFARLLRCGRYERPTYRTFTIEIDGEPTVVFEASSWSEAKELSREDWLRADLSLQLSAGAPLSTLVSNYRVRYALPAEVAQFEQLRDSAGRPPGWSWFTLSNWTAEGLSNRRSNEHRKSSSGRGT